MTPLQSASFSSQIIKRTYRSIRIRQKIVKLPVGENIRPHIVPEILSSTGSEWDMDLSGKLEMTDDWLGTSIFHPFQRQHLTERAATSELQVNHFHISTTWDISGMHYRAIDENHTETIRSRRDTTRGRDLLLLPSKDVITQKNKWK